MGARVIAVETSPERMKLAEEFGADAVINAAQDDPVAALKELTRGVGVASRSIAPVPPPRGGGGALREDLGNRVHVGEGGDVTLDVSPDLLRRQVTLIGSWTSAPWACTSCAEFIASKRIPLERISATAGGSSRPPRHTASSIRRRPARVSSYSNRTTSVINSQRH